MRENSQNQIDESQIFEILVKENLKPVLNFIYQLTGDQIIAEDLVQETFLKAWKNIKKYDQEKNFKTWLFVIAKNTTYDYFKKKKSIPFSYFENEHGYNTLQNIGVEDNMEKAIDEKINFKKLEKILEQVPIKSREVLYLCYKEDFTLQEISEILGESYNTIKSRHSRGLSVLRKYLS